jgi:hypothetical protein
VADLNKLFPPSNHRAQVAEHTQHSESPAPLQCRHHQRGKHSYPAEYRKEETEI